MAKFYLKYIPARAGLTGSEFMAPFLDEHFPDVSWTGVVSDDICHYGILEGQGDSLSKALWAVESKFSLTRMEENEFIGACYTLYDPESTADLDTTGKTFIEFMSDYELSISENDILGFIKKYKRLLFKEVAKKKFQNMNDTVSAMARAITLLTIYSGDLTTEEQTRKDGLDVRLKTIYSKTACLDAYEEMIEDLENNLTNYYTAAATLESQSTIEDALSVEYSG